MSATFLSLSVEIHLIVNANLNDLDDAVSLARSCTYFYGCFQRYKRSIARSIIVRKPSKPCHILPLTM